MKIKNWNKHQHYKNREGSPPPWIKMYRSLLEDHAWSLLTGAQAKLLIELWLLAAETHEGKLPPSHIIAFRLRRAPSEIDQMLRGLIPEWIEADDSDAASQLSGTAPTVMRARRAKAVPPAEYTAAFEAFWAAYPRKQAKAAAHAAWHEGGYEDMPQDVILSAVEAQAKSVQWLENNRRYVPAPTRWLRERRYEDSLTEIPSIGGDALPF